MGTLLKSKFPDASQGPTLWAGLSKDSSLRPAMLTLCTKYNLGSPFLVCVKNIVCSLSKTGGKEKRSEKLPLVSSYTNSQL